MIINFDVLDNYLAFIHVDYSNDRCLNIEVVNIEHNSIKKIQRIETLFYEGIYKIALRKGKLEKCL